MAYGGRGSDEAWRFVRLLARARARGEVPGLRKRAEAVWHRRFVTLLAVAAQRPVGESFCGRLEGRGAEDECLNAQCVC